MNAVPRFLSGVLACIGIAGLAQAGAAGVVKLPPFERHELANGAVLVLMEKHDTPLVALSAVLRGGALEDAPGREGTAALLAELTQKGAGKRNAAQFAEAVEGAGGQLGATAGIERSGVGASFLARDVDLMIELVSDALMRPQLDAAEFEKVRTLAIQSIAAAKDSDPSGLIGEYGDAWLFRGHPYGRAAAGDERSLAAVTLDDVKRYYAAQARGDRLILAVVGDFKAADMKRRLETAFGGWAAGRSPLPVVTAAPRVEGRRVLLVDKPGSTQTYFWLGNVGASRTDPERTSQSVVNTVFGGQFTSMLNTELRIKSGLTYGAGSGFDRLAQPGAFRISSFTQAAKTAEAIDLALATLDRLHAEGLTDAALASARSYMLGQFPPTLETNGQLAGRLAEMVFYDLGTQDVNEFAARVMAVDPARARTTIDASFPRSGDLAMVLIGDAAAIRDAARKYGPVTEMKITDPWFAPR